MSKQAYKKYSRDDHRALAAWAADCAERVLPLFEQVAPHDDRPRRAIAACRAWVETGIFSMAAVRGAALAAHAAARALATHAAACCAARAAGHAAATPHVPQHAYGAAYYALKVTPTEHLAAEYHWQKTHLPAHLRDEVMQRIIVDVKGEKVTIRIIKGEGY